MVGSSRQHILGVMVSPLDYQRACDAIIDAAQQHRPLTATALAVHGVMTGALDPCHRQRLNALDLVLPDGQPVRWALNWLYRSGLADRVYGPTLMLRLCARAETLGLAIALYGSKPEVMADLRRNLLGQFPRLRIVATIPSRFSRVDAREQAAIAQTIAASGADLLFVGLGCPRQEVWLYENRTLLSRPTVAVGAAFDFHAGRLAQAPPWLQSKGLEWLFRLWHEPRRLWRRYILLNPLFVAMLVSQACGWQHRSESEISVPYEGYA